MKNQTTRRRYKAIAQGIDQISDVMRKRGITKVCVDGIEIEMGHEVPPVVDGATDIELQLGELGEPFVSAEDLEGPFPIR